MSEGETKEKELTEPTKLTEEEIKEAAEWSKLKELIDWAYMWYLKNPEEYNQFHEKWKIFKKPAPKLE